VPKVGYEPPGCDVDGREIGMAGEEWSTPCVHDRPLIVLPVVDEAEFVRHAPAGVVRTGSRSRSRPLHSVNVP